MAKRTATSELTDRNWDDEEEPEEVASHIALSNSHSGLNSQHNYIHHEISRNVDDLHACKCDKSVIPWFCACMCNNAHAHTHALSHHTFAQTMVLLRLKGEWMYFQGRQLFVKIVLAPF